jgi:hypothetical protein
MADRVLFAGWNRPVIGREKQAIENFGKAMQLYSKWQAEGRIESFDTILLDLHGGDLNGFVLIKGTSKQIMEIQQDEAFIDIIMEFGYIAEGAGVVSGRIGEGVTNIMSRYMKLTGQPKLLTKTREAGSLWLCLFSSSINQLLQDQTTPSPVCSATQPATSGSSSVPIVISLAPTFTARLRGSFYQSLSCRCGWDRRDPTPPTKAERVVGAVRGKHAFRRR